MINLSTEYLIFKNTLFSQAAQKGLSCIEQLIEAYKPKRTSGATYFNLLIL